MLFYCIYEAAKFFVKVSFSPTDSVFSQNDWTKPVIKRLWDCLWPPDVFLDYADLIPDIHSYTNLMVWWTKCEGFDLKLRVVIDQHW